MREAATICPRPCDLDLESGVRVTCDVGYLCANFSLARPLCSRLRPDVRDRQTSDAHHRLMPPTLEAGHNKPKKHSNHDKKFQVDRTLVSSRLLNRLGYFPPVLRFHGHFCILISYYTLCH